MKKFLKIILVLASILVISALVSPFVYQLLPMFKFQRIFHRVVMILAIVSAVLFVRVSRKSMCERGFDFSYPWKRLFMTGYAMGFVAVCGLTVIEVFAGERSGRTFEWIRFVDMFFSGLVGGFLIGVLEEFFFRGFIFKELEKKTGMAWALFVSCVFYSLVHFLKAGQLKIGDPPTLSDSFRMIVWHLEPFVSRPLELFPQFFGLFVFGLLLNVAYIRTRTLFLPIGIHAASVFVIKLQSAFLLKKGGDDYHILWGGPPLYDGPIEWLVLFLLAVVVMKMPLNGLASPENRKIG